jgi:hypothetical protein
MLQTRNTVLIYSFNLVSLFSLEIVYLHFEILGISRSQDS